jgi:hypothetical protein
MHNNTHHAFIPSYHAFPSGVNAFPRRRKRSINLRLSFETTTIRVLDWQEYRLDSQSSVVALGPLA